MASNFANILLFIAIISSFVSNFFFFNKKTEASIRSFRISGLFVILSFFLLIYFFYTSNFSIAAVYENSHSLKPTMYKVAGAWGNHEGSLLLFVMIVSLYGIAFSFLNKKNNFNLTKWTIFFQNNIVLIFLIYLVTTSNPFDMIVPHPREGLGLNPILQDPLLVIHPPFLYLGYVGFSLTLSLVLASLIIKSLNSEWAQLTWPWVLSSWVFLTIGIGLGSIWAYYELGWGGYWFWDPVENSSLMPWLASTALLHTMLSLKVKNLMKSWTALLAILTFSFSLLGTFLVRSGVLNSVHAFANDPERGIFILTIIFIITFVSFVIFVFYKPNDVLNNQIALFSKESFLLFNNYFLLFFLTVIVIGTIYPIILSIFNETISVGPSFYNTILAPFIFIFLILMGIGPMMKWSKNILLSQKKIIFYTIAGSLILSAAIIFLANKKNLILFLGLLSSIYLMISILIENIKNREFFKLYYLPKNLSHFGFALLIFSIFLNSHFSLSKNFEIKDKETIKFNDISIKLNNRQLKQESNFYEMIANFEVKKSNFIFNLNPSVRKFFQPNQITSETSIVSRMFSDHYIVVNFQDRKSDVLGVRYYFNYFIYGIWLGLLLIISGGLFSAIKKRA